MDSDFFLIQKIKTETTGQSKILSGNITRRFSSTVFFISGTGETPRT